MSKRRHIIIVEPSAITRCGVATILQQIQSMDIETYELNDISALSTTTMNIIPDMIIVNPSYAGQLSTAQLKGDVGNEYLKVVALQSSFVDQSILHSYDSIVSIYDGVETITEKVVDILKDDKMDSSSKRELSIREKEIIVCVVKGMTNKLIADTLNLSTHTVIAHRRNIANKLQIHSPSGLTIYAIVNKLVDLADIKNSISQNKDVE